MAPWWRHEGALIAAGPAHSGYPIIAWAFLSGHSRSANKPTALKGLKELKAFKALRSLDAVFKSRLEIKPLVGAFRTYKERDHLFLVTAVGKFGALFSALKEGA